MPPPVPTASNIAPDETGDDACTSDDVFNANASEPRVTAPMVKPLMVTVRASVALTAAKDVVSTTAVALVGPHAILRPSTLLAPAATTGVM